MAVSSLEVSIITRGVRPRHGLLGEADVTSITRLDEALTAQISGQAVQLAIGAANLRYGRLGGGQPQSFGQSQVYFRRTA
jgi:hypothetical protein